MANRANERFEVLDRQRLPRAWTPEDLSSEHATVAAPRGLPPTHFEPALSCPRCGGGALEASLGGGEATPLESIERLVESTAAMLPGTSVSAVGDARRLELPGCSSEHAGLVSVDFMLQGTEDGVVGRWYLEGDIEPLWDAMVTAIRESVRARFGIAIVERREWSGVYLDEVDPRP